MLGRRSSRSASHSIWGRSKIAQKFSEGMKGGRASSSQDEMILCVCGCGQTRLKYDSQNRLRRFIKGHNYNLWKGRKFSKGYWYIRYPMHPQATIDGYVLEHRLIMEKKLGRYLTRDEVVHHVNRITTDNREENLQLFENDSEHCKYHQGKNIQRYLIPCACGCGKLIMNYDKRGRPRQFSNGRHAQFSNDHARGLKRCL